MKTAVFLLVMFAIYNLVYRYRKIDFTIDSINGIKFHKNSWSNAIELARTENKMIFLEIYATWCGPCKMLKTRTFSNLDVGEYFNNHFINVALNGEVGEGLELSHIFSIRGYPTLLFITTDGQVKSKVTGYLNPRELIDFGKTTYEKINQ